MATIQGTVTSGPFAGQTVEITLPTFRIPEAPPVADAVELVDKVAIFDESEQKTSHASFSQIRNLVLTGGSGTGVPPVVGAGRMEIIVTVERKDGARRVVVPELEGEEYTLTRTGYGELLTEDWLMLPSGGFELTNDDVRLNEIFIAHLYNTQTGNPGNQTPAQSIVNGIAVLNDDTTLNIVHRYKLLHPASPSKNIVITLEKIEDAPPNLIIPIETSLAGNYKTQIKTQNGQFIYMGNQSITSLWLNANEFIWLLRGSDGYYVMNVSEGLFRVGQPVLDYATRINTVVADGSLITRKAQPRLWEWLQQNASCYVTEAIWQSTPLARGKFSTGTITTGDNANFRLPDLQNQFFRPLNNIGGNDAQRPAGNSVGYLQIDTVGPHTHPYNEMQNSAGPLGRNAGNDRWAWNMEKNTGQNTGTVETRPKNVGLLPLIYT